MVKKILCGVNYQELSEITGSAGFNESHNLAVLNAIYKKGIKDLSLISKVPKKLKNILSEIADTGTFAPVASMLSADKTIKYLFTTSDGRSFETVYIPENKRTTVCVSTQSGCRMGCPFCVTSGYGFRGNLTAGEIINQIISLPDAGKVTHVVFMGMGEPMDNIDNVLKACEILTSEWGLSVSPRNITVSTVGITGGVRRFLEESTCNLALSLHSPFPEERRIIVPAEKANPSSEILGLMKSYPVKKSRRLSVAYMMMKDFNDSDLHLDALKTMLKGSAIRVNLLPYHQTGKDKYTSSAVERMLFFKHKLVISGISASIRKSRGADISAACGLLAKGIK